MEVTDDLINKIHGEVRRYLAGSPFQPAVGFEPGNPEHLEKAVKHLTKALGAADSISFRLVAAMCLLGPGKEDRPCKEPPPRTMYSQLLGIISQHAPDEKQQKVRLMEFVIAFGCGKWREVDWSSHGWSGKWDRAASALIRAMCSPVRQCREWLSGMLDLGLVPDEQDKDKNHKEESERIIYSDASVLALRLRRPEKCYDLGPGESVVITYAKEETSAADESKKETAAECRTTVEIFPDPKMQLDTGYESTEIRPGAKYVVEIRGREFTLELPGEGVVFPGGTRLIISVHDERTVLDCISYEDLLETDSSATVAETERRLREKGIPIPKGSKPILKREGGKVRTQVRGTATLRKGERAAVSFGPGRTIAAVSECTCGNVHCRERHRLEGWDPRFSLWAFAAGAVKGPIPRRTGRRRQRPEETGHRPIQIGTFVQGMYFSLLTDAKVGLECGGHGKGLDIVTLRLVPLCYTKCICGYRHVRPRCSRCDPDLARPKSRTIEPRLIAVRPRLSLARRPFLKCNDCESVGELSKEDLEQGKRCQGCGKQVLPEGRVAKIRQDAEAGGKSILWELKKLQEERKKLIKRGANSRTVATARRTSMKQRKKLVRRGANCPYCGTTVEELPPWRCFFCGSSSMNQKVTHAWTFAPLPGMGENSSRGRRVDEDEVGTDEETQSDGELNLNEY